MMNQFDKQLYHRKYYLNKIKTDPVKMAKRREIVKKYKNENWSHCNQKMREWLKRYRDKIRMFLQDHLKNHPCIDCGEDNIIVLEFDHIRDKKFEISKAGSRHIPIKKILEEIAKCEIRCANCHRIKTYREQRKKLSTT